MPKYLMVPNIRWGARRLGLVLLVILTGVIAAAANSQLAAAATASVTLQPVADAHVNSAYATTNYGTSLDLRLDASPTKKAYARFSVSGLTSSVSQATLRVYANSSQATGISLARVADNTWSEATINYNNAPAIGAAIATSGAVGTGTWVSFDVTSYVTGNGSFSFVLTTKDAGGIGLASRESANSPQLIISAATSTVPTVTAPTPTPGTTGSLAVNPVADALVDSSYPSTNYGSTIKLRLDGSPKVRSYARFNVSGLTSAVSKATLRLYANTSLSAGITAARVADNTWSEATINFNNAPAVGAAIKTSGAVTGGTWLSIDVTPYVTGNGTFSFALTSGNSNAVSFGSRESTTKPQLVIQTGTGTLPLPTATVVGPTPTKVPATATPVPSTGTDATVLFTGDSRTGCLAGPKAVANLLDTLPSSWPILFNGDATSDGLYSEFRDCFDTTYGRHKAQLRPVPGNHEYHTSGASGYFQYYGAQAGPAGKGYYSFNAGSWHIIALNSEIDISSGSAEVAWLKSDLAANPTKCTLAYWHEPRFSSGEHGNNTFVSALYQTLYDNNAEVVLHGHDHDYERFAPQNPSGGLDNTRGIREFVVGTGGVGMRPFGSIVANSQVRNTNTWGVLQLNLHAGSYDWKFLPVAGSTFTDSGSTACH